MASVDIGIIEVPKIIIWHCTLTHCCLVPSKINCLVRVLFQTIRRHPLLYFFNAQCYVSWPFMVWCRFKMCVQLSVICIGMCTESMTLSDCSDVGCVEKEKYRSNHTSLRNVTIHCQTSRPLPVKNNHFHSIADELIQARADPRIPNDVWRCSMRMSWSTISKVVDISSKPSNVISPRFAASRASETIFKMAAPPSVEWYLQYAD